MEVPILRLGLGLLLVLAAQHAPATAIPSPQCKSQCGNVEIPYPFGIGVNCSMTKGFNISCRVQDGIAKPFLGHIELLSISLAEGTIRVLSDIGSYCYNTSSQRMDLGGLPGFSTTGTPYRFSDVLNKFTVIGCNTLGYISYSNGTSYQSGCISTCTERSLSDVTDGTCSGIGCCQTTIPRGMDYYELGFHESFTTSQIWNFSRCSYAMLMEAAAFSFTTAYINTTKLNDAWAGQAPLVMDWALRDGEPSCAEVAIWPCASRNTMCVDSRNGPGYMCNCLIGYEGNPYLPDGCKDINECNQKPNPCPDDSVCHNTIGSFQCSCRPGRKFSRKSNTCIPDVLITGVTIGLISGGGILFLAALAVFLVRKWKKTAQKQLRKRYFLKNKGILLEQLISSDQNASDGTKIFSFDELEKATNNFDHARVIGRGGHGTVYKGILTDQRVVAIKRSSKLEANAEIEEFINEVSILSQINHRNVVKLHGCCLESEVPLLVYEFVSNGTLYDLLHREQNGVLSPFPWEERLRIAVEVAGALTYLHSAASVSILHRDVKCMNVLLNDSYTAKVSDFGASKSIPIDQTHLITAVQGTFGYLDPEYYLTGQLNEKSDVYSYGVILLELLIRKKPIFENEDGEKQNLFNYYLWAMSESPLEEVVDEQILGEASPEGIAGMARLAEECLRLTRGERPTMKDVEMRLQMLMRGRHAMAPGLVARSDDEATTRRRGRGIPPVPADHHGSRQYSLELEFVSSSRVPR